MLFQQSCVFRFWENMQFSLTNIRNNKCFLLIFAPKNVIFCANKLAFLKYKLMYGIVLLIFLVEIQKTYGSCRLIVTRWVPLTEHELYVLPEQPSRPPVFICIVFSFLYCILWIIVCVCLFCWPLYIVYPSRLLIVHLPSSNLS
jgi:hypothetical protein